MLGNKIYLLLFGSAHVVNNIYLVHLTLARFWRKREVVEISIQIKLTIYTLYVTLITLLHLKIFMIYEKSNIYKVDYPMYVFDIPNKSSYSFRITRHNSTHAFKFNIRSSMLDYIIQHISTLNKIMHKSI